MTDCASSYDTWTVNEKELLRSEGKGERSKLL